MKYTTLGNSDVKVSKICLGTMTFGEQNSESEGHAQMDFALDKGVNFFDTAELYAIPSNPKTQGKTEEIIGTWFAKTGKRDQVILATKAVGPSPNLHYIRKPINFSREQLTQALEGSMRRLQTDYIDLYQLHWPERKSNRFGQRDFQHHLKDEWQDNFLEILETMQSFIEAGKIRYFGISNETSWGAMHFMHLAKMHALPRPVSIQNPYSLLNRTFEVNLSEVAIREKVGLLAYSPLAFGMLSGKYHTGEDVSKSRLSLFPQMDRYQKEQSREATSRYIELAKEAGLSPAQMALAFINQQPFLTSNIIGATTMAQLEENIGSIDITLEDDLIKAIDTIHNAIPNPAP